MALKVPPLVPVSEHHRLPAALCRSHQRRLLLAQAFPLADHEGSRSWVKRQPYGTGATTPKGTAA